METLYFENISELCCTISDNYNSLDNEYADVSVIAKYSEAKEIIKELLRIGHEIASIDIQIEKFDNYYDEYIISINFDGVWCEKFKRENRYIQDDSAITFVSNECNSACLPYIGSKSTYAFEIGTDGDCDDCATDKLQEKESKDAYVVTVKCDLDSEEALEIIKDMENRMVRMNDAFAKMYRFRKLFNW